MQNFYIRDTRLKAVFLAKILCNAVGGSGGTVKLTAPFSQHSQRHGDLSEKFFTLSALKCIASQVVALSSHANNVVVISFFVFELITVFSDPRSVPLASATRCMCSKK